MTQTSPPTIALFLACCLALLGCGAGSSQMNADDGRCATAVGDDALRERYRSVESVLDEPHRRAGFQDRDRYRHPAETLAFFGLNPEMRVIEMAPGGGWYTEVLAPHLRHDGQLVVATADPDRSRYAAGLREVMDAEPEIYDRVERRVFSLPDHASLGEAQSADMVLTFRSTHGWINGGGAPTIFGAMFDVLRTGGVLGLVQHRAEDNAPAESAQQGYVSEQEVIRLATEAGFVLDARSDINRNPADTHDHAEGVWTLPPTLRLGEEDRERYEEIGESDRMTLRFIRPEAPLLPPG